MKKKTILITGATGLIGKEVVKVCLNKGHIVHYLSTSKSKLKSNNNYKGFYWNPDEKEIDERCLFGVDTIINLVGASISKRWTEDYKNQILNSRTQTAALLLGCIKTQNTNIEHIVSASAIGIYPSSLVNYYEENVSTVSNTFLGKVVEEWEQAVDEFKTIGAKVAKVRIGLVLADKGGALPEIIKPIRFGLGAAFGTGEQWQSWIHVEDLAKLFVHVLDDELEGIYNGVAPNPVTNSELTKTAAKILKKPLLLPNIPKVLMKLILGEMHILLFESQRVSSGKIEGEGFQFDYHHIEPALKDLLT